VLAGPGTGKTTTLVECVVDRIERRGDTPDSILVLTFSRKAAADLRGRIAGRLGRTTVTPMAMTFHALCYALVRRFADEVGVESNDLGAPLRLLTGPEQEFRVRETLSGSLETQRAQWPESLARAFPTRAFAGEVRAVLAKARQLGMDPDDIVAAGHAADRQEWVSIGAFFDEYLDVLDAEGVLDYAELVHRCRILLAKPEIVTTLRREIGCVFVDEYQDTDPSQVRLLQVVAGDGRDVIVVGDPDQSIYAFRGAEARGILDFPELFRTSDGAVRARGSAKPDTPLRQRFACSEPQCRQSFGPAALATGGGVRGVPASDYGSRVAEGQGGDLHLQQLRCRGGAHRGHPAECTSPRQSGLDRDGSAGPSRTQHDSGANPGPRRGRGTRRSGRR
jgi:superfamily I DNA/RNA helicase